MEFFIRKNSTDPILKMQLVLDGRNDFSNFHDKLANSTIYFSMKSVDTGILKVANKKAFIVSKVPTTPNAPTEYYSYYKWTKNNVNKVFSKNSIVRFQDLTLRVPISENVVTYAVKLASSTRPNEESSDSYVKQWVEWGAGPRASQYLALGAKAKALLDGRPTPSIEDIQSIAPDILRHRVLPNFNAEAEGIKVDDIVAHLIKSKEV